MGRAWVTLAEGNRSVRPSVLQNQSKTGSSGTASEAGTKLTEGNGNRWHQAAAQQPTSEARRVPLATAANELPRGPSLPAALLSHLLPAPISRRAKRTVINPPSRASGDPPEVRGYPLVQPLSFGRVQLWRLGSAKDFFGRGVGCVWLSLAAGSRG